MTTYSLSFISQRGKLLLRFYKDGQNYKSKSVGTPALASEIQEPSPALDAILSKWQSQFKTAVYKAELDNLDPFDIMFPSVSKDVNLSPYQYFYNVSRKDAKCRDFFSYISKDTKWEEFTDKFFEDYSDYLDDEDFSENSKRSYMSGVRVGLDKARRDGLIFTAKEYSKILHGKVGTTTSVYLNRAELELLAAVGTKSDMEESVKIKFLIGAYTGARYSDYSKLNTSNLIEDEYEDGNGGLVKIKSIQYVSEKTKIQSIVPLKPIVEYLLGQELCEVTNSKMNRILPILCERAGINSRCSVIKADKLIEGEKWELVRSHTARKSFATNLYVLGADIRTIASYLGHKSIQTTLDNYIVCGNLHNEKVINGFFK